MDEESDKPNSYERFTKEASAIIGDIAGTGAGAFIGSVFAGPAGAIAGAAAGNALARKFSGTLDDMAQRVLSKREEARIGTVLFYTGEKIKSKIAVGFKIRDDGFFRDSPTDRSSFEEIFEGLLISAKKDHEEKKLPYYGNLMANILFTSDIDKFQANLLIRVFEELSYRQLCVLALIGHKDEFKLREDSYRSEGPAPPLGYKLISLLQEIKELNSRDLVAMSGNVMLSIPAINPAELAIQGTGGAIYEFAELDDLCRKDYDELNNIAGLLR